jgi:hypothetical protein
MPMPPAADAGAAGGMPDLKELLDEYQQLLTMRDHLPPDAREQGTITLRLRELEQILAALQPGEGVDPRHAPVPQPGPNPNEGLGPMPAPGGGSPFDQMFKGGR